MPLTKGRFGSAAVNREGGLTLPHELPTRPVLAAKATKPLPDFGGGLDSRYPAMHSASGPLLPYAAFTITEAAFAASCSALVDRWA